MTLLFKSKPSQLGPNSGNSPPSENDELETDENEDEDEDEDEEEEEYDEFEAYDPISTPFISPGFDKNNDNNNYKNNNNNKKKKINNNGNVEFNILGFVATVLRKSLLVTCSVEIEDNDNNNINNNVIISNDNDNVMEISCPTSVRHISHVTFDRFRGFLGLPAEFQPEFLQRVPSASASVFGVSPQSMQCSIDERGNSVPTILLRMQKRLYAEGGLQTEGIFRITAENSQEASVRSQLNRGIVPPGIDVHGLAGLIKAWLRELPQGVLDCLTPEQVMECNTEDECTQLVKLIPPMEAGLLDWTINLMADVAQNEQYNKMNARNIAMVFAPNMTRMADPLTALIHAVQVMNFLKTLIVNTLQLREAAAEKAKLLSLSNSSDGGTTSNPQKSISFGELLIDTHQEMNITTGDQILSKKLLRSVTLDQVDCNPEKKHQKSQKKNDDEDDTYASTYSSPVTSIAIESGDPRQLETGILERLNFRKGVKKLRRHPVFQLSKLTKKTTELGIVNSSR